MPRLNQFEKLEGRRFNYLVAIKVAEIRKGTTYWLCLCDCGVEKLVSSSSLKRGFIKSCGCKRIEALRLSRTVHGGTGTPEYRAWAGMKSRCLNPEDQAFHNYGGRGIEICDRWQEGFEFFLEDMGKRPSANHSLDRIENNKGYYPENCRWATAKEQVINRRNTMHLEFSGICLPTSVWADRFSIKPALILRRIKAGWSIEDAITKPSQKAKQ